MQELVRDLQREYGVGRPFKDEALFTGVERLTGPDIGAFFQRHLNEPSALPVQDWLGKVGIALDANGKAVVLPKPTKAQRRLRAWWIGR